MLTAQDFFDLSQTTHAGLFAGTTYVWDALAVLSAYIRRRLDTDLKPNVAGMAFHPSTVIDGDDIYIGAGTVIEPGVYLKGPAIIGRNCEIRQGAYLRGDVILGDGVVLGHTSEIKHSLLLDHAHAPHFAYIGDSLLGARVNLGAGTKLSNLTVTSYKDPATRQRPTIAIEVGGQRIDTGLSKFGAVLGDDVQLGCNCVTNPGCLVGPRTLVYALVSLAKGYHPADSVIKLRQQMEVTSRRRAGAGRPAKG
ncbi:MAG: hypothetical protein M5R40_23805 [Anaerolineae bacterium]|nr:hypothetical protein [Anaerolineae bacterium]